MEEMEPGPYNLLNCWQLCFSYVMIGRLHLENLSAPLHVFFFDLPAVFKVVFEKC